ncbi:MAG: hypothetical protein AAB453_01310 [Patescibacteria group bacterium]
MKLITKITGIIGSVALLLPTLAFAAPSEVTGILDTLQYIVDALVPIVMVLAVLLFFWGLAKYILAAGNEESKASGKTIMIGGIVALFVMTSVWGLVGWLGGAVGLGNDRAPNSGDIIPN